VRAALERDDLDASPAIRLACEAALIPAASAPMTTIRSVIR
jgi:hypothetical protein